MGERLRQNLGGELKATKRDSEMVRQRQRETGKKTEMRRETARKTVSETEQDKTHSAPLGMETSPEAE